MAAKPLTRRERVRTQRAFPAGMFVALLTAVLVTLAGVFLGFDPLSILFRSSASAVFLGCVVSIGVSIVRMTDAEYKTRQPRRP